MKCLGLGADSEPLMYQLLTSALNKKLMQLPRANDQQSGLAFALQAMLLEDIPGLVFETSSIQMFPYFFGGINGNYPRNNAASVLESLRKEYVIDQRFFDDAIEKAIRAVLIESQPLEDKIIRYILLEYEAAAQRRLQPGCDLLNLYRFGKDNDFLEIEHISPLAALDFRRYIVNEDGYIINNTHGWNRELGARWPVYGNLGNQMLLESRINQSASTREIKEKLEIYAGSATKAHMEIKKFMATSLTWGKDQVEARRHAIVEFCQSHWDIRNIAVDDITQEIAQL